MRTVFLLAAGALASASPLARDLRNDAEGVQVRYGYFNLHLDISARDYEFGRARRAETPDAF